MQVRSVPIDQLIPFDGNARRGDVSRIAESLRVNGQYKPIVVNRGSVEGTVRNEVLAGNHTLAAARQLGWSKLAVVYVDVGRDAALRIMLADNRTNDLAGYDDEALLALLREVGEDGWDGTAFDIDDFAALLDALAVPEFDPDEEADVRLDRKSVTTCPECGHVFTPVTRTE